MKHVKYFVLLLISFFAFSLNVFALDVDLLEVSIKATSDTIQVEEPTIHNKTIQSNIVFFNVGDYVIYQLDLDFDPTEYRIDSIEDDNHNPFIKTNYRIDKNTVYLSIEYENITSAPLNLGDLEVTIRLVDNHGNVEDVKLNPKTEQRQPVGFLIFIIVSLGVFLYLGKKKNLHKAFIFLAFIPVVVCAKQLFSIKVSLEHTNIGYIVRFHKGENVEGRLSNIVCYVGEECALPINTFEKEGFVFKGWASTENGTVEFEDNDDVYNLAFGGHYDLYPVWAAKYLVHFHGNGSSSGSMDSIECIYGDNCVLPSNEFSKPGYSLAGWASTEDGNVRYTNGETVTNLINGGEYDLYAKWTPNPYTITFNGNGSTSGSTSDAECTYDSSCTLSTNHYVRSGYLFLGWTTTPGGNVQYNDGQSVLNIAESGSITLYAKWMSIVNNFSYTGAVQTYRVLKNGNYKLQVWGAQGGYRSSSSYAGKGGYSIGTIHLTTSDTLYVYVGGSGGSGTNGCGTTICPGGFNGGGYRYKYYGGGGASDIRVNQNSLYARVIVAGGGGSDGATNKMGMYGGGSTGGSSTESYTANDLYCGKGGTQTYSGYSSSYTATSIATTGLNNNVFTYYGGGFGFGGGGVSLSSGFGGAGGGGWYGGSGTVPDSSVDDDRGGGGGSGYIYTSTTASNYPSGCLLNSSYYLTNASTTSGNSSFVSTSGGSEIGHAGHGYARITYIE